MIFALILYCVTISCKNSSNEELVYHYFNDSNAVKSIQPIKDGKLNGIHLTYFKNGNLKNEVEYVDGIKSGKYVSYYENGVLKMRTTYRDNKKNGRYFLYYENEFIQETGIYEDDIIRGVVVKYSSLSKDQIITKETIAQFGEKTVTIGYTDYDLNNKIIDHVPIPYIVNFPADTLKFGREYLASIELTRHKYDTQRLLLAEYNVRFELESQIKDTIYADNSGKFNFKYIPQEYGDQVFRVIIEDLKIEYNDNDTIEYINNKLIEYDFFVIP